MEHAIHLVFPNDEYRGRHNRDGGRHTDGLARKAAFPGKITGPQNRHNGFFPGLINHRELHAAFLNVQDLIGGIALPEDRLFFSKRLNLSSQTG